MTPKHIQVLPEHLANKIAAGEVIQRPESVVKELLENSLDASGKNLIVVIKEGGKKLIQIVDDGWGMGEGDAVKSFQRHATSKIATVEDLERIRTYGFRGEALASIAAVAQVTMKTRQHADDAAIVVRIEGGGETSLSREGREPGTSVVVQNLFYNVPARRKFLKSTNTEFRHIYDAVQRVAISHPDIALQFVSDDETIFDLRPSPLEDRLADIFGERQVQGLLRVEERTEYLSVYGYIGKPTFGQKSRANQFLFLNKRYIVNRNIGHAIFSGYENLLLKGSYPFYLLFLELDPTRVDVNVHPSKLEAKFEDEQNVYRFVSSLVRKSLASSNMIPAVTMGNNAGEGAEVIRFTDRQHSWPDAVLFVDRSTGEIIPPSSDRLSFPQHGRQDEGKTNDGRGMAESLLGSIEERFARTPPHDKENVEPEPTSLIWQLHNKYILSPIRNGLMIIDQHVAHERILYEQALQRFENNAPVSQQLLFPYTLQLPAGDYSLLIELLPYFQQLGFVIKPFGKNTVLIEGVPPDVQARGEEKIVENLLALYKEYQQQGKMDARDNLAKSFSCKAAIKAGDKLNEQEMRSLVDRLFETKMPYVCPHGRPVVLRISIEELDRRFGRT